MYMYAYVCIAELVEVLITGVGEVTYGNTARFEANVKSFFGSTSCSLTWQKSRGRIKEQIDIHCEKYEGSDDRQLIINSVCKKDEGEYQASLLYSKNCIVLSNSIYLKPIGGIVYFQ